MKLIKASLLFSVVTGVSLLGASISQAGLIAGGTPGTGSGIGGNLVGPVSIVTGAEGGGFGAPFGSGPNRIEMTLDVFEVESPFSVDFTLEDGSVSGSNDTVYEFAVTINNDLLYGKELGGMDIKLESSNSSIGFLVNTPRAFASGDGSPLAFEIPNLLPVSDNVIRFGGLNGGGGAVPFGGSQTLYFSVFVSETTFGQFTGETLSLRFTANPEPEAIMLGCFTLALGGFFVYRRRNQKIEVQAEAV